MKPLDNPYKEEAEAQKGGAYAALPVSWRSRLWVGGYYANTIVPVPNPRNLEFFARNPEEEFVWDEYQAGRISKHSFKRSIKRLRKRQERSIFNAASI